MKVDDNKIVLKDESDRVLAQDKEIKLTLTNRTIILSYFI